MRISTLAAGLSVLRTSSAALQLRAVPEPRVVQWETTRVYELSTRDLGNAEKRDLTIYPDIDGHIRVVVNATIGTPPQNVGFNFDSGSSDVVIRTTGSAFCAAGNCTAFGSYDPTKSSTYTDLKVPFTTRYGEGSVANGSLVTDVFSIGGFNLTNFTIASCDTIGALTNNVLGVGYPNNEGQATILRKPTYQNLLFAMKDAGLVATTAFSVWLNDINAATGSILFGGVDTAKYSGTLQTIPIVPAFIADPTTQPAIFQHNGSSFYGALAVTLDGVGTLTGKKTTLTTANGFPITVLLDTGSTGCSLPRPVFDNLCSAFGGCQLVCPQCSVYMLPCNSPAGNVSFLMSGVNVTVPLTEFLRPNLLTGGMCLFDVTPTNDSSSYILGDPFFRATYVVFDLENNQIAVAPTVYNATTSNVVEIMGGIPNAQNASGVRAGIPSSTGTIQPAVTANGGGRATVAAALMSIAVLAFLWAL